ncbi:lipopolysaccharide assembly protein LapB [Rhodoferax saidenbachensis]|uniref:Lipopolysaccharide assembly protein B n=1 Tax=Rhodoferax saidenbachensis TaxID=1484693 RepID=A0A1P8K8C3_9BURK|nr:lipopolysaccharide assembly protein LapB [Rhodoferax saidenbachensis]APW42248.1 lipopolysaccharide assembly protein LapB [Rhodoferax saidenbachensis]
MEFDLTLILLGLPVAFVLGWLASRMDMRQLRLENRQAPKAYFKGLNFLLNEQQDQAIDAFIEAVQNDPDTSELHFALGNLFRRRGEYERAVRVHQHLLSRGDLVLDDRHRAQHALALDYLKAGLLDRAEEALRKLEGTRFEAQARLALLANYERSRDWPQAAQIAEKLESAGQGSFKGRLAHYLCEQAATLAAQGDTQQAQALLTQATQTAPEVPRPRMDLARLQDQSGDPHSAALTLMEALDAAPSAIPLIAAQLTDCAMRGGQCAQALAKLKALYAETPSLDVLDAIVALEAASGDATTSAREWYAHHLEKEPSLVAAAKWIAGEKLEHEQFHPQVQRALDHAVKPLTRYRCAACGFEAKQHFWQCPGCQAWDSYPARRVEEL